MLDIVFKKVKVFQVLCKTSS